MRHVVHAFFLSIIACFFTSVVRAQQNDVIPFSPYADITINTHWDPQYQDLVPMDLVEVSQLSHNTSYHLAFITDAGGCNPAWGGQANYAINKSWGEHLTDKMRAHAIEYIISLGGASGSDISLSCSEPQLIAVFDHIINVYHPKGLDFDIENGSAQTNKLMNALKATQTAHPKLKISFTLPVLPDGLTSMGQEVIYSAKDKALNYTVNIMAMDYGPAYSGDMGQYAIQAAKSLFVFLKSLYPLASDVALWQMVEVTPMIGVNDVYPEQFTLSDVDTLTHFAHDMQLGALSMWSITRDMPCPDQWASPFCSGANLQSKPYEFSQRFIFP
jgi:chitinase